MLVDVEKSSLQILRAEKLLPLLYPTLEDFIRACGCSIVRDPIADPRGFIGLAPGVSRLQRDGTILVPRPRRRDDSLRLLVEAAHEAAHWVAGAWSLDDELPMLPWELSVILSVGDSEQRKAAMTYLLGTPLPDEILYEGDDQEAEELRDLVADAQYAWREMDLWISMTHECLQRGLNLDGKVPQHRADIS